MWSMLFGWEIVPTVPPHVVECRVCMCMCVSVCWSQSVILCACVCVVVGEIE